MVHRRYESMWIDFIGAILVEVEVAERHPNGDPLWPELGMFLEMITENIDRGLVRARRSHIGRMVLRHGVPNFHIGVQYNYLDENEEIVEEEFWFEFVHSSTRGRKIRRIVIAHSNPPMADIDYE